MTTEATGTGKPQPSPAGRPEARAAGALVGELFAQHGRMVLGLCRLLLRDPIEAEDAAQQVFLSAHRSVLGGAIPREPAAWLAAIARNECRARIRARMRAPLELPQLPDDLPDPLAAAIRRADLDEVWAALSTLPRRQRKAILLRELGGLSYGELGVALGVSRPAVESLLFRARQQLRGAIVGVNLALVPVPLRGQLERLIPNFATPNGAVPMTAKVAAVAVGVGIGAAGAVELPRHHVDHSSRASPPVRTHVVSARPSTPQEQDAALAVRAAAPVAGVVRVEHADGGHHGGAEHHGRSDTGRGAEHEGDRGDQRPGTDDQEPGEVAVGDEGDGGEHGDDVAPSQDQEDAAEAPEIELDDHSGHGDGGGDVVDAGEVGGGHGSDDGGGDGGPGSR